MPNISTTYSQPLLSPGNPQESYINMWGTNNQFRIVWLQTLVDISNDSVSKAGLL